MNKGKAVRPTATSYVFVSNEALPAELGRPLGSEMLPGPSIRATQELEKNPEVPRFLGEEFPGRVICPFAELLHKGSPSKMAHCGRQAAEAEGWELSQGLGTSTFPMGGAFTESRCRDPHVLYHSSHPWLGLPLFPLNLGTVNAPPVGKNGSDAGPAPAQAFRKGPASWDTHSKDPVRTLQQPLQRPTWK